MASVKKSSWEREITYLERSLTLSASLISRSFSEIIESERKNLADGKNNKDYYKINCYINTIYEEILELVKISLNIESKISKIVDDTLKFSLDKPFSLVVLKQVLNLLFNYHSYENIELIYERHKRSFRYKTNRIFYIETLAYIGLSYLMLDNDVKEILLKILKHDRFECGLTVTRFLELCMRRERYKRIIMKRLQSMINNYNDNVREKLDNLKNLYKKLNAIS